MNISYLKYYYDHKNNNQNWPRSHGNHSSNKFSSLKKINSDNVSLLKLEWTFKYSDKGPVPGNPIFFEDKIFVGSPKKSLIARFFSTIFE